MSNDDDEPQEPPPPRPSPFAGRSESVFDSEGPFTLPGESYRDSEAFQFSELSSELDPADEPTDAQDPTNPDPAAASVLTGDEPAPSGEDPTSISPTIPQTASPMAALASTGAVTDRTSPLANDRSRLLLVLLISYASAVTLALLLLLLRGGKSHQLESLPDVAPEPVGQLTFVPVDAELPEGHVLGLGESRRFGNVLVEPLRIVREPIGFTHFSGDQSRVREQSAPALKLWVRFSNLSSDQTIVPIDRNLLFRRVIKRGSDLEYTNQYLFSPGAKTLGQAATVYPHPPSSEWDLADQKLGVTLAPGESVETYLASTDEGLDVLGEDIRWRIQFRKGISPGGNGVTTIIDAAFRREDIQDMAAANLSGPSRADFALQME